MPGQDPPDEVMRVGVAESLAHFDHHLAVEGSGAEERLPQLLTSPPGTPFQAKLGEGEGGRTIYTAAGMRRAPGAGRCTLPALRHLQQTLARTVVLPLTMRIGWRLGNQRREVRRWEWLTLRPT